MSVPPPPEPTPLNELPLTPTPPSYPGIVQLDPREFAAESELLRKCIAEAGRRRKTFYLALTMEMLQALYAIRGHNRKPSRTVVQRYLRVVLRKAWKESHQGFSVNWDGFMDDGLQRVIALILALQKQRLPPIEMPVTFGVDPEAFMSMDSGRVRSANQNLTLAGMRQPGSMTAAIRFLYLCEGSSSLSLSHSEVYEEVMRLSTEHPGLVKRAVHFGDKLLQAINLPAAAGVSAYLYIAKKGVNIKVLEEFFEHMVEGTQADLLSPVRLARQKLIVIKKRSKPKKGEKDQDKHSTERRTQEIAYIIAAYNLYARGRKAPALNWPYWDKTYALPEVEARDRYGGSMVHHRNNNKSDGDGGAAAGP